MKLTNKLKCFGFKVRDIFDEVYIAKSYDKNKLEFRDSGLNYVVRTSFDNGVNGYVEQLDDYEIEEGNCIIVGGEATKSFYQDGPFIAGTKISVLRSKHLTKSNALYICTLLNIEYSQRYSYGRLFSVERLKLTKLLLPSSDSNDPDWNFMDKYINEIEQNISPKKLNFISPHNSQFDNSKWQFFDFDKIFHYERGSRLIATEIIEGDIAYISSTKSNNGIDTFVSPPDFMVQYNNCMTLSNSGSVGYLFYHNYNFVASDHVTVLWLIDEQIKLNSFIASFLKPIIESIKYKYSFGREISNHRIKREKILLPVNGKGEPDWEYMEEHIKALPYSDHI